MKQIIFIIYLALSSVLGVTLSEADIPIKSWKYWLIFGCFIGAYICGIIRG